MRRDRASAPYKLQCSIMLIHGLEGNAAVEMGRRHGTVYGVSDWLNLFLGLQVGIYAASMVSIAVTALCLLMSTSLGHAAARTLLQEDMPPASAPSAYPSGSATAILATSFEGECIPRGSNPAEGPCILG